MPTKTRKRRWKWGCELDDSTITDEPPIKKRRLTTGTTNTKPSSENSLTEYRSLYAKEESTEESGIVWENKFILNKKCIDKLRQIIHTNLSISKHGFSKINDSFYESIINTKMNGLQTVNGLLLKDIPNIIYFLKGLRAETVMNKQLNASHIMPSVLKTYAFRKKFDLFRDSNKLFDESDKQKWIQICNAKGVPPYMLLTHWLKKSKVFFKNKQITQMIKSIESNKKYKSIGAFKILKNESFRNFCLEISTNDLSSFQFEPTKAMRATEFEVFMCGVLRKLMSEKGIKSKIITEEMQRAQRGKNRENMNLTPDVLFSKQVLINGRKCKWIDMKNYFIKDGFLWNKMKKKIKKYYNAFGPGAIICRGFSSDLKKPANCLFLDAFFHRS